MKSNTIRFHRLTLALVAACPGFVYAAPSATSAYMTDVQNSYVQDQTSEGIGTLNSIMCYLGAMAPSAMVNKGDYIALIDESKCDANRDSSSNSGSGGATAPQFTAATVNSSRDSNSTPMIGKVWVEQSEQGQAMTIFVHASATEAPTATNPYGTFRMDYCGKPNGGGACMFNGFIDAGAGGLSFYETESDGGQPRTKALALNANGTTSGSGKMALNDPFSGPVDFTFAYNADYFLRDDGSGAQCFSRDATDSETGFSVWRYGLYDATTGARITRNSGFPIEYTSGGVAHHGYMGYYGLWLPQEAMNVIVSGDTVKKVTYGAGAPTTADYTLVKTGGKLTKYTKGTKTLAAMDQIRFTFWAFAATPPAGIAYDADPSKRNYEMYWDNTAGNFVITGLQSCSNNGCQMASMTPVPVTDNNYWSTNYPFGISGWSQSAGGELSIVTTGLSAATVVTFRTQDVVYPSDYAGVGNLSCITDCPTAADIGAYDPNTPGSTPFGASANRFNGVAAGSLVSYTLNAVSGNAENGGAAVVSTMMLAGPYQSGIRSGKLFPTSQAGSVVNGGDGMYYPGGVEALTVYYVWETGPNPWNQFSAVKDSGGNFVHFDAPLNVNYTVPSGAAYGVYAGTAIVLQYGGFGDLWGIPGKCVDPKTNAAVDCAGSNARFVPEFAIPFSQTDGVASDGSTNYLVKWLEREIRFARKTGGQCSNLVLPSGLTLPTSAGLKDPSTSSSDVYIGPKPTVTAAPRVIQGVVQY